MVTVPPELHGVWRRTLLQTAGNAVVDSSTRVLWLQTASLFGDLRVLEAPLEEAELPPLGACDAEALSLLAKHCQCFAGHTVVEGDVCTWKREVDSGPPPAPADVGRLHWASTDKLYEDDLAGREYHEVWEREEASRGAAWAFRLEASDAPQRKGFLCVTGDCFMFVADREKPLAKLDSEPVPPPGCTSSVTPLRLAAAMAREKSLAGKQGVMGCEASYGRVSPGEDGSPPWRIELSTLPSRAGQRLLPVDAPRGPEEMVREYAGGVRMGAFPPDGGWRLLPAA